MKAEKKKLGYVGKKPGSRDSNSWYTPKIYIEKVNFVLDKIDIDPFSSEIANSMIMAKKIFTEQNSAFNNEWGKQKTCWMNPPYGVGICKKAVEIFLLNLDKKSFNEAIVLTNNSTDTKWFKKLASKSSVICFTDHRISFDSLDKKTKSTNTRGQCFFYFGKKNKQKFIKTFREFGLICIPDKRKNY